MNNLFDVFSKMPEPHPGKTDTSRSAAGKLSMYVGTLRYATFTHIKECGDRGATPSEIAKALGKRLLGIRPRTTELRAAHLIYDSGIRRQNEYGNNEIVWKAEGE